MLTTCPAAAAARRGAGAVAGVAARDSVPRDRARAAKPVGRPCCRNAGSMPRAAPRSRRNTRAGRTSAAENLRRDRLGAGPRAPPPAQLPSVPGSAADNAGSARGVVPGRARWSGTGGWPWPAASAAPPGGTLRCN